MRDLTGRDINSLINPIYDGSDDDTGKYIKGNEDDNKWEQNIFILITLLALVSP